MGAWYSGAYRRHLADMHIADWDPEFLSEFSPEAYFACLKRARINAPMIYLQSHAGHCYFPTRVGHMHAAFRGREDAVRRLVELCRADGMHVVGYYSLIYNTYEEDRHPEWRIVSAPDGTSARQRGGRYGHCCPNNPEYRAFITAQIAEIARYFTLDGMFYDMTFWPAVCRCPFCVEQYRRAGLWPLPQRNDGDPAWRRLTELRTASIGEFARFVTETTRRLMPGVSVEHNYAHGVAADSADIASSELVNEQCDYTGGDLYGDLYNHSFTAKYYYGVTKHPPFEYMTCRCDRTLAAHTVSKSEDALAAEVMLTAAHHGASLIIDAIDPRGTLDARVYDRIGRVFARQIPYEPYFTGTLRADVGVYYSTTGRYNSRGLSYTSKTCSLGAARVLTEAHIPFGILSNAATGRAADYRMILAPGIAGISDGNRRDLAEYVRAGGTLYISGTEDASLLAELLGVRPDGYTEEGYVYLAPTAAGEELFGEFNADYPLPTELSLPKLDFDGGDAGEVLAVMKLPYTKPGERRFASIHSNPPGVATDVPALLVKRCGAGRVIWSAAPIENDGRLAHKGVFAALVRRYLGEASVSSDAPRQVELVTFDTADGVLVSAVDLLYSDERLPVRGFTVSVRVAQPPRRVVRLGGEGGGDEDLPFAYDGGYVRFTCPSLTLFAMFRIEAGERDTVAF